MTIQAIAESWPESTLGEQKNPYQLNEAMFVF
jgi:hypothetical protein